MNIQLLLTGDELMSGDITDSNSVMIADQLAQYGLSIQRKVTVGDQLQILVEELHHLSKSADILIVNGGLGPTVDDLTAQAISTLCGSPLIEHKSARAHLQYWADNRGLQLNEANLKQAMLPGCASIIDNPVGTAVGFSIRFNNCLICCTPGVPSELKLMLSEQILPLINDLVPQNNDYVLDRFHTFGQGESNLQQWINNKIPNWPKEVSLGFRAGLPTLEVKIRSAQKDAKLHLEAKKQLTQLIGDYIVSSGKDSQAQNLVKLLADNHKTITTAESCTGGLISSMITAIPGSSSVFEAGYITYSNRIKSQLLGVKSTTLQKYGAVSQPVVLEMAQGALDASQADYVVAVSGIAGPGGATADKPVGTVWIAWGEQGNIRSAALYYPYQRNKFQTLVAGTALDLIRRQLQNILTLPRYIERNQATSKNN